MGGRIPGRRGTIVYNNFPWPQSPTEKQKQAIETAAQRVLEVRGRYPEATLAALYDPQAGTGWKPVPPFECILV
jgi:hypothetical protein